MKKRGRIVILIMWVIILLLFSVFVISQEEKRVSFDFKDGKLLSDKGNKDIEYSLNNDGKKVIILVGGSKIKIDSEELFAKTSFQEPIITGFSLVSKNDKNFAVVKFSEKGEEKEINIPLIQGQLISFSRHKGGQFDSLEMTILSNNVEASYEQLRNSNPNYLKNFNKILKKDDPNKGVVFARFEAVPLIIVAGGVYAEDLDLAIKQNKMQGGFSVEMDNKDKMTIVGVNDDAKIGKENVITKEGEVVSMDLKKEKSDASETLSGLRNRADKLKLKKVKRVESIQEAAEKLNKEDYRKIKNVGSDKNIFTPFVAELTELAAVKAGKHKVVREEINEEGAHGFKYKLEGGLISREQVGQQFKEVVDLADENGDGIIDRGEYTEVMRKVYAEALGESYKPSNKQESATTVSQSRVESGFQSSVNIGRESAGKIRVPSTSNLNRGDKIVADRKVTDLAGFYLKGDMKLEKIGNDALFTGDVQNLERKAVEKILTDADDSGNKDGFVTRDELIELEKTIKKNPEKYRNDYLQSLNK